MKVILKTTGGDVTGKFLEDLIRVTTGKKAIHFPKDKVSKKKVKKIMKGVVKEGL